MPPVTVIARAQAKPGKESELKSHFLAVVPPTHEETGCIRYALHRSVENPAEFVMVERWESKEHLDRHLATPHVQKLFKDIAGLVLAPPDIAVLESLPAGRPEKYL